MCWLSDMAASLLLLLVSITANGFAEAGQTCLTSRGDLGTCTKNIRCSRQESSRSCGRGLVCCEGTRRASSAIFFPDDLQNIIRVTTPRTIRRTTTRTTTTRRTTRRTTGRGKSELNSGSCGRGLITPQVFGGHQVKIKNFPFIVSFVRRVRGKVENACGGALLTSRHILSAAHCFDEGFAEYDVKIGLQDVRSREKQGNRANIRRVKIHEEYRRLGTIPGQQNSINDIAIVTLDRDIPVGVTKEANTVCLPSQSRTSRKNWVVLGFGATSTRPDAVSANVLHAARVKEMSRSVCQAKYDQFLPTSGIHIDNNMVCAGDEDSDACRGDSGSPLVYYSSGKWTVGGVVSFGPTSCANKVPGVFADVSSYLTWIHRQIT